jgi:hypothetical protein
MEARRHEPKDPEGIGKMPKDLDDYEKIAWKNIVNEAIPGVLRRADRQAVKIAAKLLAKSDQNKDTQADRNQLIRLLGQFGMTPSERSRISLIQEPAKNEFEED